MVSSADLPGNGREPGISPNMGHHSYTSSTTHKNAVFLRKRRFFNHFLFHGMYLYTPHDAIS